MANPVGRPTKYTDQTCQQARDYIENYDKEEDMIPSIAGLAVYLGVSRETIYDWASQEEKQDFSDILTQLLATQERILIGKGLSGKFNSTITKLVLGKHGYSEKKELSGDGGGPILVETVSYAGTTTK